MKILFVASEVNPFAKTGGLADVAGALPRELRRLGHDVRIVMPFYRAVERSGASIRKGRKSVEVTLEGRLCRGFLRQTQLGDIPVYLIEQREFFGREFLYGPPDGDYSDNPQRFAYFCRGVIDLLRKMDFRPEVIHCHDWQTALVPIIIRYEQHRDPFFKKTACVFTIHNVAFQGIFPRESLRQMGLDSTCFRMERLEYFDMVNLLKGGILTADVVTTVSPTYCQEIQTPEYGYGMEGILKRRSHDLVGILNGIDAEEWDPGSDRRIYRTFTSRALAGKAVNKRELQTQLGLERNPEVPLLGMVSRMAVQKGHDLIEQLIPRFAEAPLQLVVLGTGDARYQEAFRVFKSKGYRNISITVGFEADLGPRIYAGADMFLMPSLYEPCGLSQLIALRYGAVPVVRKTGGLADTVFDPADHGREANGFTFAEFSAEECWTAIERAMAAYRDRQFWTRLQRSGMTADYSWRQASLQYEALYRRALSFKGGW